MAKDSTPLTEAAAEFEQELAAYARLGKLFLDTPLSSVKHLERANGTLGEIAQCEERLQKAGQALVQALSASRDQQEQLAKAVVAHVPAVQARNTRLQELMQEMGAVAGEVSGLNETIQKHKENGDATKGPSQADARDVGETVLGLSARAEALAAAAREAEFEEVATQAHALHQRLQAIGKKLQKAGGV
jgi:predicted  nucleic acid-binding Zn-ribbon protein